MTQPQSDYVQVGEPVGAWSKLLASDAALMAKVTALQLAPNPSGSDFKWRLIDCAVEHLQAELAGLRQDKERLEAAIKGVTDGMQKVRFMQPAATDEFYWRVEAADMARLLASRSLPGAPEETSE